MDAGELNPLLNLFNEERVSLKRLVKTNIIMYCICVFLDNLFTLS